MSKYMDYEAFGNSYDEARVADGIDMMCNMITGLTGKSMAEINLLDAGCGTGNYSLGFLERGLKSLKMIDASETMLKNAKCKVEKYKEFVDIQQMALPKLEFANKSFDVITFVQVLHHIDSVALHSEKDVLSKDDYPNLIESLKHSYRILRSGGVLMLDTMFEENIDSFWWTSLCPKASKTMKRTRIKKEDLFQVLRELDFTDISYIARPNSSFIRRDIYDSIENIGDAHWRSYLSQYKLVETSGELDGLIDIVQKKIEEGTLQEFFAELNRNLLTYGHHVTVFAKKAFN